MLTQALHKRESLPYSKPNLYWEVFSFKNRREQRIY